MTITLQTLLKERGGYKLYEHAVNGIVDFDVGMPDDEAIYGPVDDPLGVMTWEGDFHLVGEPVAEAPPCCIYCEEPSEWCVCEY